MSDEINMRERLALAVYEHRLQVTGYGERERILTFVGATGDRRTECYAIADAVLAALVEPTEAMFDAGNAARNPNQSVAWNTTATWADMIAAAGK